MGGGVMKGFFKGVFYRYYIFIFSLWFLFGGGIILFVSFDFNIMFGILGW